MNQTTLIARLLGITLAIAGVSAAQGAVSLSKSFLDPTGFVPGSSETPVTQVQQGDIVIVAITAINSGAIVTGGSITDLLPTGMVVANPSGVQRSAGCGSPVVTATPGSGSISYTNGQIPAAVGLDTGECTVYVRVRAIGPTTTSSGTVATLDNTIGSGDYRGVEGGSPVSNVDPISVSLQITKLAPLGVTKTITPSTLVMGQTGAVSIVISNPNAGASTALTSIGENLPSRLIATNTTPQVSCSAGGSPSAATNATASATSGNTTITFPANTLIAAGGSCTVTWTIRATVDNNADTVETNTIPADSIVNNRALQSQVATADVFRRGSITTSKAFYPNPVRANQSVTLSVVLQNLTGFTMSSVSFNDPLQTNGAGGTLTVASGAPTTLDCGAPTITAVPGSANITASNITVAPGGFCTINVPVIASDDGSYPNATSSITYTSSDPFVGGPRTLPGASSTLTVYDQVTGSKSAIEPDTASSAASVGPGNQLSYVVNISNYSASALTDIAVNDALPAALAGAAQTTFLTTPAPTFSGCTGTVASASGASNAQFTSISIPAGVGADASICSIRFWIQLPNNWPVGTDVVNSIPLANITQAGAPFLQGSGLSASTPTVDRITIAKSVTASPIFQGAESTAVVTLYNNNFAPVTGVSIVDNPVFGATAAGEVRLATPVNPSTTCSGTPVFTAAAGSTNFQVTGLTVPRRGSCEVRFNVRGVTPGNYVNTIPTTNVSGTTDTGLGPTTQTPPAAANANLDVQPSMVVSKNFFPTLVNASGGGSRVTVTVNNVGTVQITGLSVVDPLPLGLVVATVPAASTTCAGPSVLTAVPGQATATLSGATLAPGGSCLFQFDVQTTGAGSNPLVNSIPAGGVSADNNIATTTASAANLDTFGTSNVLLQKAISPTALLAPGQTARLTVTVGNSLPGAQALTNLSVTDNLPAGMVLTTAPNPQTTCVGGVVETPNIRTLRLVGASLAISGTCTFSANVTMRRAGSAINTLPSGAIQNDQGSTNADPFNANLTAQASVGVSKGFFPSTVAPNQVSRLRITVLNPLPLDVSTLALSDTLPTGVQFATPAGASTTCGGTVTITGSTISLAGGALSGGGATTSTCEVAVNVVSLAPGLYPNSIPIGAVTAADEIGNAVSNPVAANADLQVRVADTINKSFANPTRRVGEVNTLTITINNANDIALNNAVLQDNLPTGVYVAPVPNTSTTCGPSAGSTVNVAASSGGTSVRLTGALLPANGSCSFSVDVLSNLVGTWNNVIPSGSLRTDEGVSNTLPATASFTTLDPPTVGKAFFPVQIASGGTSKLRIVLGNTNAAALTMSASMTDNLPQTPGSMTISGIDLATVDPLPRCGGISSNATSVTVASGTSIPAGGCIILVDVTGTAEGVYSNVIAASALQTDAGPNATPATADLLISNTLASITGNVYADRDNDGVIDLTDRLLPAQTIELLDSTGAVVATTTTNSLGNYAFLGIAPGTYSVRQPNQPVGTTGGITTPGTGSATSGTATAPATAPSQIAGIVVNGGQSNTGNNFGEVEFSSISGVVYRDANNNGVIEGSEAPISGVTVTLVGVNDLGVAVNVATTTGADGSYSFPNLRPGNYSVIEGTQPSGTTNGLTTAGPVYSNGTTSAAPGSTSGTATDPTTLVAPPLQTSRIGSAGNGAGAGSITLPPNATSPNNNFGEVIADRTISGRIFIDIADNGIFNGPDTGSGGYTVTLTGTDINGAAVLLTVPAAADGTYSFAGLPPGTYAVSYNPAGAPSDVISRRSVAGSTGGTGSLTAPGNLTISGIDLTASNTDSGSNNFTLVPRRIDVAKTAGVPLQVAPKIYEVPYIVVVGNRTSVNLTNVQAADHMQATYPTNSSISIKPGSFLANAPGSAAQCAGPTTAYNGTTAANLLAGNFDLAPGELCVIRFVVVVDFGLNPIPAVAQNNSVYASTASGPNAGPTFNSVTGAYQSPPTNAISNDISVHTAVVPGAPGAFPATNPTLPTLPGQDAPAGVPTPVNFTGQVLDVIKNAGLPVQVPASSAGRVRFEVPYTVVTRNSGPVTATNVQTVDRLVAAYTAGAPAISVKPASFAVAGVGNAAQCAGPASPYNGDSNIAVLAGNFNLAVGEQCTVTFTAVVEYVSATVVPTTTNENLAFTVSSGNANPTGGTVTGSGAAAAFTPDPAASAIIIDVSSGNTAVMGNGPAGTTTFATTGGTSGNTGPTTSPSATVGNQQLPTSPGADNSNAPSTKVLLAVQQINVIKAVGLPRAVGAKVYEIPYTMVVQNTAAVPLTNTQVAENLTRTFNPTGAAGVTVSSAVPTITGAFVAPAGAAPTCAVAAPAFNGLTQTSLLAGTETLLPGQQCVISLVATVNWGANALPTTPLNNQVYAAGSTTAQTPGTPSAPVVPNDANQPVVYPVNATTTDASTNVVPVTTAAPGVVPPLGSLPAVDPTAAASPTPVSVQPARIDVVKQLVATPLVVDGRTFDITYNVTVGNTGGTPAYNMQMNDYLRSTFALPSGALPTLTNGGNGAANIVVTRTGGTAAACTVASNFNGNANSGLLAGVDTFAAGETCAVTFTVRVQYGTPASVPSGTAQDNFVYASSTPSGSGVNAGYTFPGGAAAPNPTPPTNVVANDVSTNGSTLPTQANGDITSPTPVTLSSGPDLVVRKSHTPVTFTERNRGSYTIFAGNRGFLPTQGAYTVTDTLPVGMTVATLPTGTGWNCAATVLGSTTAICSSSLVMPAGAGTVIENPNGIVLTVDVAAGACANATSTGQCIGANALVNNVRVAGGGELDIPFFTGNNSFADPTPLQQSGGVSGQVWFDLNHDRINNGEPAKSAIVVEVLDGVGVVVGTGRTDNSGNYQITGLVPGPGYGVRFRDAVTGAYYGRAVSRDPAGGNDPTAATAGVVGSGLIQNVTVPGGNAIRLNQSLPLDPAGVVYDSVTRAPVAGAIVEFLGPTGALVNSSCVVGGVNRIVTAVGGGAVDGGYSFLLLNPAPPGCPGTGDYSLRVTPPGGYVNSLIIPAEAGRLTPPAGCVNAQGALVCAVQSQLNAPTGNQPTPYYNLVRLTLNGADIVNNHIPLDPAVLPSLFLTKASDRMTAEVGDLIRYTIRVRRTDTASGALARFLVSDALPAGFRFIAGTTTVNGVNQSDPAGAPGPALNFVITPPGGLAAGGEVVLTYRVRLGVGSAQGTGINRAQSRLGDSIDCARRPDRCSNEAQARVRVNSGVFSNDSCVVGKIYVDCNNNHVQDKEEIGIPGVRMYFQDGTYLISDVEGKYSYCGLPAMTHVLKVDPLTLPQGSRLTESSNRNVGDPGSLFLDLKGGELHRADFIEGSCSNQVLEQVKARRTSGEVRAPENERRGRGPLKFEGRSADFPQQGTDSADQPIVQPRERAATPGTAEHVNDVPLRQEVQASTGEAR
jgi:large repetitive protein